LGTGTIDGFDPHVFASGNPYADIMFLGEAPGADEVVRRIPLIGRAGQFFENNILGPAGLDRNHVYILCRPKKNRTPFLGEIEECLEHLDTQILLVSPKLIVALGSTPLYASCDIQGITKARGKLVWSRQWSDGRKVPVFPMFHPAYCLRNSGLKETRQDVITLTDLAKDIAAGKEISP